MEIKISEDEIREIVKEESEKAIRKRIREMQGDYTSKGYLEEVMKDVIWNTLMERIPNLEQYVYECVEKTVKEQKQYITVPKKSEIIDAIVEALKDED